MLKTGASWITFSSLLTTLFLSRGASLGWKIVWIFLSLRTLRTLLERLGSISIKISFFFGNLQKDFSLMTINVRFKCRNSCSQTNQHICSVVWFSTVYGIQIIFSIFKFTHNFCWLDYFVFASQYTLKHFWLEILLFDPSNICSIHKNLLMSKFHGIHGAQTFSTCSIPGSPVVVNKGHRRIIYQILTSQISLQSKS